MRNASLAATRLVGRGGQRPWAVRDDILRSPAIVLAPSSAFALGDNQARMTGDAALDRRTAAIDILRDMRSDRFFWNHLQQMICPDSPSQGFRS